MFRLALVLCSLAGVQNDSRAVPSRTGKAQGLKPIRSMGLLARLKSCPFTKRSLSSFLAGWDVTFIDMALAKRLFVRMAGLAAMVGLLAGAAMAQLAQPDGGAIERGSLPERWRSRC